MLLIEIPARRGKAAFVQAGQVVEVINTHGEQVVDTWAFSRNDLGEFLSNEHTRAHTLHMTPRPGDILRSNRRRPILALIEDTSGGVHDTLIAACGSHRYAFLGVQGHHDNCQDNLFAAMAELGLTPPEVPTTAGSVHEHPMDFRRRFGLRRAASADPRRPRATARGDGYRRRPFRLPSRHPPDKRQGGETR